ncbi:hypothetical protein KIN20_020874 [Parelaphostrongylus tenuis]|uniref:Uncharacterized protein n=1 Tax=Parelaphostrongylus tenuis TaxID=148309 RepID=A0AAD5QR60_PARTN|nr:hypothetical protein KIN20_020874 [Parelaphostrongylus tenuis]
MSLSSEDSVVRAQRNECENITNTTARSGLTSSPHVIPPLNIADPSSNITALSSSYSQQMNEKRRSVSPISPLPIAQHQLEPQLPPTRPTGTCEYGYTYGSSPYRHGQSVFLGSPKLPTRYQPDHLAQGQINRSTLESRRRQISPFYSRNYAEKLESESYSDRYSSLNRYKASHITGVFCYREFPVNHDWEESSIALQEPVSPTVYLSCAMVIWSVNGYYGFLCEKNTPYGNLHFYADSSTIVQDEDNKTLGELPGDRLLRGHRVEIETEFVEPDVSDPEIHHLIYVRSLAKIGTEINMQAVHSQILVPLTKKTPAPYFRALSESGDLVYVHPSILLAPSLIDSMKVRLSWIRLMYVEDMMHVLCSNRTIRGDVAIAPRWLGDAIGRTCNFKRVLISCEPHGDVVHGYGTVLKALPNHIIISSQNSSDLIYCSVFSVSPWSKVSYKVGVHVRYTACLDMPNSTHKWRCLGIVRTSETDINDCENSVLIEAESSECTREENMERIPSKQMLFGSEDDDRPADPQSETKDGSENMDSCFDITSDELKSSDDQLSKRTNLNINIGLHSPSDHISPITAYPAEANEDIPLCMNEISRNIFSYGDEPHCHFTIPDEVERFHYMNYSPLYKSMEDFVSKSRRWKEKSKSQMLHSELTSKIRRSEKIQLEHQNHNDQVSSNVEMSADSDVSITRFQFIGIDDDIEKILSSTDTPRDLYQAPQCPDGWWYRRTTPRRHPTVVVAEFIENRDIEKDCNENVNVTRLTHCLTIRNAGVFDEDGLLVDCPATIAQKTTGLNSIVNNSEKDELTVMSLLRNDQVIGNFFSPLLMNIPESMSTKDS